MEQKDIDIFEILKNEEYGTELYTPKCGKVWHSGMANDKDSAKAIWTEDEAGREHFFDKNGKIYKEGEVLLFPSKEMRDWSKFFKKGDVLVCYEGKKPYYTIFDGFGNNTYQTFNGKFAYDSYEDKWYQNEGNLSTITFHKLSRADSEIYITKIEERFGGKLNLETLEIEKTQPEFKNGDIAFADYGNRQNVFIVSDKTDLSEGYNSFISLCLNGVTTLDMGYRRSFFKKDLCKLRLATEEEKRQLFSALEKEGKAWDAEKRQVVGLKPAKPTFEIGKLYVFNEDDEDGELTIIGKLIDKNESEVELFEKHYAIWKKEKEQPCFKTFDKVLVRIGRGFKWRPALFIRDHGENCTNRYNVLPLYSGKPEDFEHCIPYEGHEDFAFADYDYVDLPF